MYQGFYQRIIVFLYNQVFKQGNKIMMYFLFIDSSVRINSGRYVFKFLE